MDIEFFHDSRPVGFSGFRADVQKIRGLLARLTFGHKLKDLPLSGSEGILHDITLRLDGLEHSLR
jgi:hypothetical protein